jgi:C1A family cysteine protease
MMIKRAWKKRLRSMLGIALLLGLLPLLAAAPAGPNPSQAQGQPPELVVSAQEEGLQIQLAADQGLAVRLRANPSTGYLWQIVDVDERVLQPVGPTTFEPDSSLLGAPGTATLRFRPVAAGKTNLALVYRRPWEEEVLADFSLQVTTDGSSSVTNQGPVAPSTAVTRPSGRVTSGTEPDAPLTLPSAFNWCALGGCTPVKNQQNCGSCWAFATVGPLESWVQLSDGVTRDLSEQYLVSCNTDGMGCNGGWWAHDYHQWKAPPGEPDAGAVYEADFPYVAADVACNPPHVHHEKVVSWEYVDASVGIPSLAKLKQAIHDYGPVSVAMCAGPALSNYTGGVFAINEFCPDDVNHGVVLVGWDDAEGVWLMKNSWGPGWGEGGYARIAYGTSNIGYGASYVIYGHPMAPDNLHVTSTSQAEISLAWRDGSSTESSFKIERSPDGTSSWAQVGTVAADVTAYTDTGLALSTTYYYRVRAYNLDGDSAPSNLAEATTWGEYTTVIYLPLLIQNDQSGAVAWLQEGFEQGEMPPSGGWSTADTNTWGHNWTLVDRWSNSTYVHTGDHAAYVRQDVRSPSDEWLLTPPIDLGGASGATLEFWAVSDTQSCGANVLLHVTGLDGTVVETVWNMCADEGWNDFRYRLVTVDLSTYGGQVFKLAWQYEGIDGERFGLDDVHLYASSGG